MKSILKLILIGILITQTISAQDNINYNLEISYKINYNTEIPNTKIGILYVDKFNLKSLFIYGKEKDRKVNIEEDETSIIYKSSQSIRFNYTNQENDTLISKDKFFKDEFLISEKIPNFNWTLIDEEKKIDSISVKKAILNFRGRKYIAWYSPQFPVKFGPWKFNNLPGLIIEIYSETLRYHWLVTSIKIHKKPKTINLFSMSANINKISIRDFVNKRYNQDIHLLNDTRLPRGSIITSRFKSTRKRNGIEIKFEWEEEKKKQ